MVSRFISKRDLKRKIQKGNCDDKCNERIVLEVSGAECDKPKRRRNNSIGNRRRKNRCGGTERPDVRRTDEEVVLFGKRRIGIRFQSTAFERYNHRTGGTKVVPPGGQKLHGRLLLRCFGSFL